MFSRCLWTVVTEYRLFAEEEIAFFLLLSKTYENDNIIINIDRVIAVKWRMRKCSTYVDPTSLLGFCLFMCGIVAIIWKVQKISLRFELNDRLKYQNPWLHCAGGAGPGGGVFNQKNVFIIEKERNFIFPIIKNKIRTDIF